MSVLCCQEETLAPRGKYDFIPGGFSRGRPQVFVARQAVLWAEIRDLQAEGQESRRHFADDVLFPSPAKSGPALRLSHLLAGYENRGCAAREHSDYAPRLTQRQYHVG